MKILLIMLLSLLVPCFSNSQESKSLASLIEALELSDKMKQGMELQLIETLKSVNEPNHNAVEEAYQYIKYVDITSEFVESWKGKFTINEIQELVIFFKTKTGKKLFYQLPEIRSHMTNIGSFLGLKVYETLNKYDPSNFPINVTTSEYKQKLKTLLKR
ncbi:MAG: hypothetical protein OCC49_01115 [Fibrobacterales bacterium]